MNLANFTKEILDKSYQIPILVDFWAPWCQPCQFIGPVLEKLAADAGEKWKLVKIDTDQSREVATKYQIMSIPAIKLFHQGQIIGEFNGAIPEPQVKAWLDMYLPDERKTKLKQIKESLLTPTEYDLAIEALTQLLEEHPTFQEAKIVLAREIAFNQPSYAKELIQEIRLGDPLYDSVVDINHMIQFSLCLEEAENPLKDYLEDAHQKLSDRQFEVALIQLIKALEIDKKFCNEIVRKIIISIFHHLGEQHEITKKYRIKFSMTLY